MIAFHVLLKYFHVLEAGATNGNHGIWCTFCDNYTLIYCMHSKENKRMEEDIGCDMCIFHGFIRFRRWDTRYVLGYRHHHDNSLFINIFIVLRNIN